LFPPLPFTPSTPPYSGQGVEEHPLVKSVALLDSRCTVLVLGGNVALEHVGRLDDMVIDTDQDGVFDVHRGHIPAKYKDRAPRVEERKGEKTRSGMNDEKRNE